MHETHKSRAKYTQKEVKAILSVYECLDIRKQLKYDVLKQLNESAFCATLMCLISIAVFNFALILHPFLHLFRHDKSRIQYTRHFHG